MGALEYQTPGTTHTYVAKAWYRDSATWFLIGSIAFSLIQDQQFVEEVIPHSWHDALSRIVLAIALILRFYKTVRPVALRDGTPVEVHTITPTKGPEGNKPL